MPRFVAPLLLALALLGGWEAVVRGGLVDDLLLPAPTQVGRSLVEDRALLLEDTLVTLGEVLAGLGLAVVAGIALAVLMHLVRPAREAVAPLLVASQALPIPVIAPLVVLLLGFGLAPKVLLVALVCFFPITIAALDGLRTADPEQRRLMRTLDATRWQTLWLVEAPAALPQLFTGLRIGAAVSVIGAVFAEWAGSERGLGHLLLQSTPQLETARAFAAVVVLCALAIGLYAAFGRLERLLAPWAPHHHRPGAP